MANIPEKTYFNVTTGQLLDANGSLIGDETKFPFIRLLTEDKNMNIQLVSDNDLTAYSELETGTTADIRVDNDYSNPQLVRTLAVGSGNWTLSASGTAEYYYTSALNESPEKVYENAVEMTAGTLGALTASDWGYGDNDSIGEDRLYVRLSDDTDPDTKSTGYLTYKYADGTYTPLFVYSADFNEANSWYDESTQTFRSPVITDGEMTFKVSANDDAYYDRISASGATNQFGYARCTAQIFLFAPTTAENFQTLQMDYLCYNAFINDDQIQLDVRSINVYTKSEVDAIVGGYIPVVSPAVAGNAVQLKADGTLEDAGVTPGGGGGGSGDVVGPSSATDNAVARFDTTTGKLIQNSSVTIDDSGNVAATDVAVTDDPYAAGWNGDTNVPTKNAIYDKIETLAVGDKVDKDLSGYTSKSVIEGTETLYIDDDGTPKAMSPQVIVDQAVNDVSTSATVEFGWDKDASAYGSRADHLQGSFQRDKTATGATVHALIHCDGSAGSTTFTDDSDNAHTVSNEGSPVVADDETLWLLNSVADLNDGASGLDVPVTGFDPQATDFAFTGKFYIADADKLKTMTFLHIGTGTTTKKVIWFYLDNGFLHIKIGTTAGSGDWTDQDSVEVSTAGYLNVDAWNTPLLQRVGDNLYASLNGTIVMKISMADKTLNTPDVASKVRFGYGYEGSSASDFFDGYMDEVILLNGANFDSSAVGDPFSTHSVWTAENYVTKKYDVDADALNGAYRLSFTNSDLVAGVLTITHGLSERYNGVAVFDNNDLIIIPDEIDAVSTTTMDIDLSSFGTITGTWQVFAWSGVGGGGGSGGSTFTAFEYGVAASNETADLSTGTAKVTFRMPRAITLTEVRASVNTAPVGSTIIVDVNKNGTSVLSTKLTIDASEKTSVTAATPAVISTSALADDDEITIDIDQVGSSTAGKGLKITLLGTRV